MIAIPVNKKGEEPVVSAIFAKSKWFAIIDGDTVTFEKNIYKNGIEVTIWLNQLGVKKVIVNKLGSTTFEKLVNFDITCLYTDLEVKITELIKRSKECRLYGLDQQTSVFEKKCS